jgi:hypothetical protein
VLTKQGKAVSVGIMPIEVPRELTNFEITWIKSTLYPKNACFVSRIDPPFGGGGEKSCQGYLLLRGSQKSVVVYVVVECWVESSSTITSSKLGVDFKAHCY